MVSVLACIMLSVWHMSWNLVLNIKTGNKIITFEQAVISMIAGLVLQTIAERSPYAAAIPVVVLSLVYYINLMHARFFGDIIAWFQIKQFLFNKETAAANSSMLVQAAGRLIRKTDIFLLVIISGAIASLFADAGLHFAAVWKWGLLNVLLLLLIGLTLVQYKHVKRGTMDPAKFGMLISYYLSWVLERRRRFEQEKILQSVADNKHEEKKAAKAPVEDEWFGRFKGMNVILIQLESFQQFLLHHKVEGQEITPFLNSLAREHMEFTDIFSQYAMGHTSDAELAVLHSLYPLKNEIVNYKHYDKKFFGLPKILRKHGYQAMAYHGYKGDFYNRRVMMKTNGFEAFFSEENYDSLDKASHWMSDMSFFEQSAKKIKQMKQPFFSFMISLTSHFPFELEKKLWGLQLGPEIPEFLSLYFQSVNYTDQALRHFWGCLEKEGLLENTVIAFYGDHEGVPVEQLPLLNEHLAIPQTLKEVNHLRFAKVPFIIASGDPSRKKKLSSDICGSTLDVGQTLLHLLGLPYIRYGMGESLFSAPRNRVVPLSQYPLGTFATHDTLCYAPDSGQFSKSITFDRKNEILLHGSYDTNETKNNYSREQMLRSEYYITNDLLVDKEESPDHVMEEHTMFTPNIQRILSTVDDHAVVFPVSLSHDLEYLQRENHDLESLKRLETYYRKARKNNIRLYSVFDFETNDAPIYFEDVAYQKVLQAKGYKVNLASSDPLPEFLKKLPDHVLLIVSAKDDAASQFKSEFAAAMAQAGFRLLRSTHYRHSYMNLIYKNKGFLSLYEEVAENAIERNWAKRTIVGGIALPVDLHVISRGAASGNLSQIVVNGTSYSRNLRGLNIVVVDVKSGKVLHSFRADTFATTYVDNGMYVALPERVLQEVEG